MDHNKGNIHMKNKKLSTATILKALKADYKAAEPAHDELEATMQVWRNEFDGKPYMNEQKGKSKIVSRDIKKQDSWAHASLIDPFVSTPDIIKCVPITYEDVEPARQNELVLNTQFCRQFNRYGFMTKAVKVLNKDGTVVIQTGWDYEDEEIEVEVPVLAVDEYGQEFIAGMETQVQTKVLINQPTAIVRRNEDIYIDPTCQDDMDKCQFVIDRYETDMSTLREDGRYKNLKKVAMDLDRDDVDYDSEDESEFRFEDDPRKKLVVYEYWGNYDINQDGIAEPIVCAWVGDVVIRLQSNPYPDKKPPFIVVPFNSIPFQLHGEANAALIGDNQKVKTAITRGIIDNMAQSNNGQKGIRKGALTPVDRKKFMNGQNFEFNGTPNDFWDGSYNQIPGSAFDMLGMMNKEIESITGVMGFSNGITGASLGATATGARGAMDATATRRMDNVRNIAENMIKPLMRKWMAYNSEFLNDTEVVRITNEEFQEVRRDDLEGRLDLDIVVSTAEDNAQKVDNMSFLLQTLGPAIQPEMTHMIMAEIAKLSRMPGLEKSIREYEPQPDPAAEKAKQLELEKLALENEKIKADIQAQYASAGEDEADQRAKLAKAMLDEAKIRNLDSKSDQQDLDFIKSDEEVDHHNEMQKKEYDRKANLDSQAMQIMAGDKNVGVVS